MGKLLLLFTVIPLGELYLLLVIDDLIGLLPTVAIVLTTGVVGAILARAEGIRVLKQWQKSLVRGQVPEEGVLGGVLILVGGVLLITPGVLTDLAGLLLLIPPTRRAVADAIRRHLERKIHDGSIRVVQVTHFDNADPQPGEPMRYRHSNVVMDSIGETIDPASLEDDDDDDIEKQRDRRVLH